MPTKKNTVKQATVKQQDAVIRDIIEHNSEHWDESIFTPFELPPQPKKFTQKTRFVEVYPIDYDRQYGSVMLDQITNWCLVNLVPYEELRVERRREWDARLFFYRACFNPDYHVQFVEWQETCERINKRNVLHEISWKRWKLEIEECRAAQRSSEINDQILIHERTVEILKEELNRLRSLAK